MSYHGLSMRKGMKITPLPRSTPMSPQAPYVGGELARLTSMTPFNRGDFTPVYMLRRQVKPLYYGATTLAERAETSFQALDNAACTSLGTEGRTPLWEGGKCYNTQIECPPDHTMLAPGNCQKKSWTCRTFNLMCPTAPTVLTYGPDWVAAVTGLKKGDGPGGAIGTRVKKLQAALMKQGFSVGSKGDDGDFGTNTKTALKAFMASINVAGDGSIVTAPVAQALADKGNGTYSRQGTAVDEAWYNRFFQQALPSGGEIQGAGTTFVSSWMNFMKGNVTPVPTTTPTSTYVPPAAPRVPWGMIVGTVFVSFGLIYLARSRRQRQQF